MPTEILNKVIKEKTYNVPSFILKNYEKLNLTAEEVLVLIVLYNHYGKISYDINKLLEEINLLFPSRVIISPTVHPLITVFSSDMELDNVKFPSSRISIFTSG